MSEPYSYAPGTVRGTKTRGVFVCRRVHMMSDKLRACHVFCLAVATGVDPAFAASAASERAGPVPAAAARPSQSSVAETV